MIVTQQRVRSVLQGSIHVEIVAILVIAYAFIAPMPFYVQVLFTSLVTLMSTLSDRLMPVFDMSIDKTLAALWRNHFTLREAMDSTVTAFVHGNLRGIDWLGATERAGADIKQAYVDDGFKEKIGSARVFGIIGLVFTIAFTVTRGLIGYGLARLLQGYAPRVVTLLVTGTGSGL